MDDEKTRRLELARDAAIAEVRRLRAEAEKASARQRLAEEVSKGLEKSLRESETRFHAFMTFSPVAAWIVDAEGVFRYASPGYHRMFPVEHDDLTGRRIEEIYAAPLAQEYFQNNRLAIDEDRVVHTIENGLRADGSAGEFLVAKFPIHTQDGETLLGGMALDISEHKQAQQVLIEREEDLNRAQAVALTGSWRLDVRRNELVWSQENHRIFGIQKGTPLTYEAFLATVHPDDHEYVDRKWKAALRGAPYDIDHRIIVDGRIKWVREKAELEFDVQGTLLGGFGTTQDITERKLLEEDLRKAKEGAEEASRAKTEFLANMSHEIRTPMTVIIAALEQLSNSISAPEQRRLMEMAIQSGGRLITLIDDILNLSRMESRGVDLVHEPFDLRSCVEQAVLLFELTAAEKGIGLNLNIHPHLPEHVTGDAKRLGQVLVNLLGNAVRFTESGEVSVTVEPASEKTDGILFSVCDTGIGIPAEKQHLLFNSFSQIDSSLTRKYGGTGLGLAISKKLVEMLGGSIGVESESGQGSTFFFVIPLPPVETVPTAPEVEARVAPPSKETATILLVEDDQMVREMVEMILRQRRWQVLTATNGREAIEIWEAENIDLILMDVQMPVMNGLEATHYIREREAEAGHSTPIIALTAHAGPQDELICRETGMNGYITKPINMRGLFTVIEGFLNGTRKGGE